MYTRSQRVCVCVYVCIIKKDFISENVECVKNNKNTYDAYAHYVYIIVMV